MTTRRKIAVVVGVVLAVALIYARCLRDDGDPGGDAQRSGPSDAEIAAERNRARLAAPVDRSPATIGGRVIDGDGGAPIAGAVVSVGSATLADGALGTFGGGARSAPAVAVTGADGRWTSPGLRPGTYSVSATADGYLPGSIDRLVLAPGADRDGADLELRRGGHALSGVVTDVGGGPIAGALVRATRVTAPTLRSVLRSPYLARTGADGRYRVQLAAGSYGLMVSHPDYVVERRSTEIRDGARTEDFELVPGATISGTVLVRDTEAPVSGALVTIGAPGFRLTGLSLGNSTSTDGAGRFTLRGLKAGEIRLTATAPGHASRESVAVEVSVAEQVDDVVIWVDRSFSISGYVVSRQDRERAVPEVLVGAWNLSPPLAHVASNPSGSDGYFEIHGVFPGSYRVGALGEGRMPNLFRDSVEVVDADVADVIVELDQGRTISGRVNPPGPAYIRTEIDRDSIGPFTIPKVIASQMARTRADADGRFELRGLASGKLSVVAETEDGRAGRRAVELGGGDLSGVVIELESRGAISGTVIDANNRPVARARVRADLRGQERETFGFGSVFGERRGVLTGDDGTFRIGGLDPGTYALGVRDRGRLEWAAPGAKDPEVEIAGAREVRDVRLVVEARDGIIRGTVIGPGGALVPDAWVRAAREREGADKLGADARRWRARSSPVLSNADGRFEIGGLRPGTYRVEAEGLGGNGRGESDPVKTGSDVVVKLVSLATLHGVVSHRGAPVVTYSIDIEGPQSVRRQIANPDGAYRIGRLDAGTYTISVLAAGGRASAEVELRAGSEHRENLQLVAYSSLTGVVVSAESGEPVAGVPVMAFSEGADVGNMGMDLLTGDGPKTGADGRFVISRLGAGPGTLIVVDGDDTGFEPLARQPFEIAQGEDLDIGTVHATTARAVPKDERGDYGFRTVAASWAARPRPDDAADDPGEPPAGVDPEARLLWVETIDEDGPASQVDLAVGDRVTAINGVHLAVTGPEIAAQMLATVRTREGQKATLSIVRDGEARSVTVIAE